MTTTKSYSDSARFRIMFRHAFRDFLPVTILSAIVCVLALPVYYSTSTADYLERILYRTPSDGMNTVLNNTFSAGFLPPSETIAIAFFLSALAVMAAVMGARYLHSKPMTDIYHALPVSRQQLFTVHFLAGGAAILSPYLLCAILTMGIQLVSFSGYGCFGAAYWLWSLSGIFTIFFAVATVYLTVGCFAVCLGTSFDTLAISMTLGFSPSMIYALCAALFNQKLYGVSVNPRHIELITPLTWSVHACLIGPENINYNEPYDRLRMAKFLIVWALLIAALYALAVFLYSKRKSELAGSTRSGGILPKLMKIVAAFVGGCCFYFIFSPDSTAMEIFFLLFGAVATGAVTELILSRGIRLIKKNWMWPAIGGALLLAFFFGARADFLGLERKVPAIDDIESISISYKGRFNDLSYRNYYRHFSDNLLTDPESFAIITDFHRDTVLYKPDSGLREEENDQRSDAYVSITYNLKNGGTLDRHYYDVYLPAYIKLSALETREDFVRMQHDILQIEIYGDKQVQTVQSIELTDSFFGNRTELRLSETDTLRLLEAVRTDLLAESQAELLRPSTPAHGYLSFAIRSEPNVVTSTPAQPERFPSAAMEEIPHSMVLLTAEYKNTLALLRELGYGDVLGHELENITKVTLLPANYYYWSGDTDRIVVLSDEALAHMKDIFNRRSDTYSLEQDENTKIISDPKTISAIYKNSHNQMFISNGQIYQGGGLLLAVFEDEYGLRGVKLYEDESVQVSPQGEGAVTSQEAIPAQPAKQ